MTISEVSIRRPVFATVLSLLLLIVGIMAALRLPIREYPDIQQPAVSVNVTYRGANAAVIETRITQLIENEVAGLEGVDKVWPSEANMVLLRVRDAAAAQAAMKARGVLVKNVSAMHPLLANCLRLTVGTREENAQMLAALKESL